MIIRATDQTPWNHSVDPFYQTNPIQYSSIFQSDFLKQVLKLQNEISALVGIIDCDKTFTDKCTNNSRYASVSLKDICFAPLYVRFFKY